MNNMPDTLSTNEQLKELAIPANLSVLDTTIVLARQVDKAMDILRPLVYKVFAENLWEGRFSSFTEYVESPDGLNKSQGYGSKLKDIEKHYVVEGGATPEQINGIDYECLYAAKKITKFLQKDGTYRDATIEDQIAIAKTLNRGEIKKMLTDQEATPHTPKFISYCEVCGLSEANHP